MLERLAHLGQTAGAPVDPEVIRASQNVSRALFLRPGRKAWTTEQATRVAEILDRAAAEIEQIWSWSTAGPGSAPGTARRVISPAELSMASPGR
jgi:hypothetical protein